MASKDKPKTKSLLGKSGTPRPQPIRATQPFQLLQGSPARKSPSSSPTPRSNAAWQTSNHQRWAPDHRSSPDRGDRKSPSSPSIKAVQNRRSPSPSIRRTTSLDPIGPYLTGQWPRESVSILQHSSMREKATQTPDWSVEANAMKSSSKTIRSSSTISDANGPFPELKQMRQQIRRIGKSSRHDKKERSPPVHGNHSALQQLPAKSQTKSTPITIGGQTFGRVPRRQNSVEALNKEIDGLTSNLPSGEVPGRLFQGITPPDGHRAPLPRSSTTRSMETQTPQEYVEGGFSPTPSPTITPQQVGNINLPKAVFDVEAKDAGLSPCPKYASSPRPNNSYMFKREPPEGAERPYIREEIAKEVTPGCPDKNKVNFYPYSSSAFASVGKHLKNAAVILVPEQNNNTTATLTPPRNSPLNLPNPQPQVLVNSEPRI